LYVPPGVTLIGAGQEQTRIDGEGGKDAIVSPRAGRPESGALGNETSLSGLTIENSGGNGIGN
jgi:hypothetical protein